MFLFLKEKVKYLIYVYSFLVFLIQSVLLQNFKMENKINLLIDLLRELVQIGAKNISNYYCTLI